MRYLAVTCTLVTCLLGTTVAQMTHEETVIRTAYAKLAYATEQDAVIALGTEAMGIPVPKEYAGLSSEQRIANAQISFTLTDFVVGNISDIANRKVIDFVTPATVERLVAATPVASISDGGVATQIHSVRLSWETAQALPPEAQDIKIQDFYERQWHTIRPGGLWQRYASYSVTVNFLGETRGPYKALFVFGHNADGSEFVEPEDGTTDVIGLVSAMKEQLFPDALVVNRLRTYPAVANWLTTKQMSGPACSVGQHDVCCDLARLKCGPGRVDLADALSKPLPPGQPR